MQKVLFDVAALQKWFSEKKRDLPWRRHCSPYVVWISEIMLQQTQVNVVIDYFHRWMQKFPTLQSLAESSLDEVLKMWEGLGYYSRARHLHAASIYFLEKHKGSIPSTRKELEKVKGLGPYTIGAILSFAFHQRAAAVDANVARVLARYFCIQKDISQSKVRQHIEEIAENILPEKEPWVVMEALIELGAMVCTRLPKCALCPLKKGCMALQSGKHLQLPIKKKNTPVTLIQRQVAVIHHQGEFLLKKGSQGLMAGLYEFPYFEEQNEIKSLLSSFFPFPVIFEKTLKEQSHCFTRYKAQLFPTLWKALEKKKIPTYYWIHWKKLHTLAFSSGHKRILNNLDVHEWLTK